jgi:hypothetical protein
VTSHRKESTEKNRALQEQLKGIKLHNEGLTKRKVELTQELKRAKEDLSIMIEKGEQQKAIFIKEISIVKETERKLAEARERERRQFEDVERSNAKKIQALTDALRKREMDIEGLRTQLLEINEREHVRMDELQRESEYFKQIIKQY